MNTFHFHTASGCAGAVTDILFLAQRQLDFNSQKSYERGWSVVDSEMKGSGLYLTKRGSDGILSCFATRTNLIPSHSPSHIGDGMVSEDPKSVSL